MAFIEDEIRQQPEVAVQLLQTGQATAAKIAAAIREFNPAFVLIAARGTSDNAGRYAQYLFAIQAKLLVALATPSVHTLYGTAPRLERALVIGISQSGQSTDVLKVVQDAKQQQSLTIGITNDPTSPIAQEVDFHMDLGAGKEQSVAATKTYTAELVAIAMLAAAMADDESLQQELSRVPVWMQQTLDNAEMIPTWISRYRYMELFAAIGRGYNYATAYEISLKVKELAYISGQEYSEADFRHGPIAMIDPGFPSLCIAPKGKTLDAMVDLLQKLQERRAEILVISNDANALDAAQHYMPLPEALPEWLSPLCAVLPGQVFAMELARIKGYPLDTPRGLSKVTLTQ